MKVNVNFSYFSGGSKLKVCVCLGGGDARLIIRNLKSKKKKKKKSLFPTSIPIPAIFNIKYHLNSLHFTENVGRTTAAS